MDLEQQRLTATFTRWVFRCSAQDKFKSHCSLTP